MFEIVSIGCMWKRFRVDRIVVVPLQRMSIEGFLKGSSLVVCAPTSSGKTLVAEAAAAATIARGKRLFYTTPLKALSNQKLRDFRCILGFSLRPCVVFFAIAAFLFVDIWTALFVSATSTVVNTCVVGCPRENCN